MNENFASDVDALHSFIEKAELHANQNGLTVKSVVYPVSRAFPYFMGRFATFPVSFGEVAQATLSDGTSYQNS